MLQSIKDLRDCEIAATDGVLGSVNDIYFDDRFWVVRYFVVDTGGWLSGRKVLIAPEAVDQADLESRRLPVALTCEQVRESPGIALDLPVSRQNELVLRNYYGWPSYQDADTAGLGAGPLLYPIPPQASPVENAAASNAGDPSLRSAREVTGYGILARDGEIGHVEDFLVGADDWVVRYVIVDTRNWLPGRKVLIAPAWVGAIDWAERQVGIELDCEDIKNSPPYDPSKTVDRGYEADLYRHYDRECYWS